jgi:hypothetical protein
MYKQHKMDVSGQYPTSVNPLWKKKFPLPILGDTWDPELVNM